MTAKEYDVLIVGSGHSGGMAANILTKQGVSCLMLNAGPEPDFEHNRVNKAVYELPYRGFGQPGPVDGSIGIQDFAAEAADDFLIDRAAGTHECARHGI